MSRILVTGGCGFIGSNFLNLMVPLHPEHTFLNVDCLTYAGRVENVLIAGSPNYVFSKTDISNELIIDKVFEVYRPDWIVNFAAESHVDRSIDSPDRCIETNILGTVVLLDACRRYWQDTKGKVFLQVSTDEVYGELLGDAKPFTEENQYKPSTPYAASKASADHFVKIYYRTYGIPGRITNTTNNYGPNQHAEKFIPKMAGLIKEQKPLTLHGDGLHIRDWIHTTDNCEAIWRVLTEGRDGESYNIGGNARMTNRVVLEAICRFASGAGYGPYNQLLDRVIYIEDRLGNDRKYAIDFSKINRELGWQPKISFEEGLTSTLKYYLM